MVAKNLGDLAAVVRSSTIGPLNNRTNKRNKERGVKNNRAATYSGPMKLQAFERCYSTEINQYTPEYTRQKSVKLIKLNVLDLLHVPVLSRKHSALQAMAIYNS